MIPDRGRSAENNMRNFILIKIACMVVLSNLHGAPASDGGQSDITRQIHGDSIFTFRDGKLRHELSKLRDNWIEIFYDGSVPVFIRSGYFRNEQSVVSAERFPSEAGISVRQVSLSGDAHPKRIYIGEEIYNRSENGFFEIMPNPEETSKESVIMGPEFSTRELDELRRTFLKLPRNE